MLPYLLKSCFGTTKSLPWDVFKCLLRDPLRTLPTCLPHLTKLWSVSELPRSGRGEGEKPDWETSLYHIKHQSKHNISHKVTQPLLIPELLVESVSRLATVLDLESPPRLESTD